MKYISILLVGFFSFCSAVDIELAKEGSCLDPPPKALKLNTTAFLDPSATLYNPLSSKYAFYRSIEDIIGKEEFKSIKELEILTSCLRASINDKGEFCNRALAGRNVCYELNPESKTSLQWRIRGHKQWDGESWTTFAGDDYFVAVDCWIPGEKSFIVFSLKKTLSSKDLSDIKEHVKSMGFKSEFFFEPKYDQCIEKQ